MAVDQLGRGFARGEGRQRLRQSGCVCRYRRQPVREHRAPAVGGSAHLRQFEIRVGRQKFGEAAGIFRQRFGCFCAEGKKPLRASRRCFSLCWNPCGFQNGVRIGAAKTERADAGAVGAFAFGPRPQLRHHLQPQPVKVDQRVGALEVQAGRDFAVVQRQRHLEHAGNTRARLQVADIGLDRTN